MPKVFVIFEMKADGATPIFVNVFLQQLHGLLGIAWNVVSVAERPLKSDELTSSAP